MFFIDFILIVFTISISRIYACSLDMALVNDIGDENIGIFAGKAFLAGEVFEWSPVVIVNSSLAHETPLSDYVFAWNESHSMLYMGFKSLCNHADQKSVISAVFYSCHLSDSCDEQIQISNDYGHYLVITANNISGNDEMTLKTF